MTPRASSYFAVAAAGLLAVVVLVTAFVVLNRGGGGSDPADDLEARQELAQAHEAADFYIHSEQLAEARVILERLLDRFPEDAQSHALKAKLLMAEDAFDRAYDFARTSSRLAPEDHEVRFLTALLAEMNAEFEAAHEHYRKATELAPEVAGYAMYLAQSLMRLERFDEAETHLARAQRLDATLSQTYSMQAELAARGGDFEAAIGHVDTALEHTARDSRHFVSYMLQKAELLRRGGNAEAAQSVLHDLPPAKQQEQRVVEQLAIGYGELGQPERAAAVWVELFALEPDNARAAAEAGLAFLEAEQIDFAQRYHEMARSLSTSEQAVLALEEALQRGD